jgi:hypothetical protein
MKQAVGGMSVGVRRCSQHKVVLFFSALNGSNLCATVRQTYKVG